MLLAKSVDGSTIFIGLDRENITRVMAGQPIQNDKMKRAGIPEIVILYGETLQDIVAQMRDAGLFTDDAVVRDLREGS